MPYRAQIDDHGVVTRYKDTDTGEVITAKEYERRLTMQSGSLSYPHVGTLQATPPMAPMYSTGVAPMAMPATSPAMVPPPPPLASASQMGGGSPYPMAAPAAPAAPTLPASSPLIQPGAQMLNGQSAPSIAAAPPGMPASPEGAPGGPVPGADAPPTAGMPSQSKNLRLVGLPGHNTHEGSKNYRTHGFLDATSIAILLPTLVLLALIIAAAHKKRLFPWQTIRTFNPPSGLMTPRDYERSYVCPPNLRRHGRLGKRNPQATWTEQDGIVLPFGFLARTHLPITIPLGRLPNKNMFIVAPSGSGKTTLMRAVIKALMAKPCVIVALEAKANDPNLDEKKESFKHTLLPEARHAGFETLYFNPLDSESINWNPLDLDPITFASSIVQDVNSLPPEEQHWAERDHGYISGLAQLLKWGAFMVAGEDENGQVAEVTALPCNPRGLMRLVNNRRNIVESLRRCKNNPDVPASELNELTQTLSSIIRTDSDWDKNIQGVRGRLRMFKNAGVLRCTEASNIDIRAAMHKPTVLIFGAPASMGPDAESLASCFVYQLQNALHTRYGTNSMLPLFAFFDEYQTLNMDIAGRLSAIVRGANGGLTIILQNISQIAQIDGSGGGNGVSPELKTIFSNSAIRVCLHNSDETTAKFFSEEIGKHAIIVPGISDHYDANGFGIFPTSWNRIHSQQVVARVDADSIKRMEKHHALVYLSPAGDPEYGELKPFMCDLRGIEEIARLHLLHNVAGRNPQGIAASPEGVEGGEPQLPPGVLAGGPMHIRPGSIPAAVIPVAASVANAVAPAVGAAVGSAVANGMAQTAVAAPAAAAMPVAAGVVPPAPGVAAIAPGVAAAAMTAAVASRPPFPGGGAPAAAAPAAAAPAANPVLNNGVQTSDRACTKCGKNPGKGRFCIECGSFVGQPGAAAPAAAAPAAPAAAAPAQPQVYVNQSAPNAPAFPGTAAGAPAGRQPLTSLHGDMNKYGVPGQQPAQPGQQPMPRPQQRPNGGIEF